MSDLISDKLIINSFKKHYSKIGFNKHIENYFKEWFKYLTALKEFKKNDFSLFEYSSISKNRIENKKKSNNYSTSELWKKALQGSIDILKRHDLRENPDCFYSKNKQNLKSKNLPDISELADYYEKAIDFEKILYGSDPWYRDHFAHVLRVWLLGLHIVFKLKKNTLLSPSFSSYIDSENFLFNKKELLAAYTISALTHDLGYPLEKLKKLNKKISEILDSFGGINWSQINASLSFSRHESAINLLKLLSSKASFHKPELDGPLTDTSIQLHIDSFIKKRETFASLDCYQKFNQNANDDYRIFLRCQWKYYEKYFDSLENMKHGFLSVLLLQRKLIFFKEGEFAIEEDYPFSIEEARQYLIRREILRSIATHTCDSIYIINTFSIESLLFFSDEIQEWGRPNFSDLYGGSFRNNVQKVFLHCYQKDRIAWVVDIGDTTLRQAIHWLMSVSRKYSNRLRPAPEVDERNFTFKWTLKWKIGKIQYEGIFRYEKKEYYIEVKAKNSLVDLKEHNENLDSGKQIDFEKIVEEISKKI